MTKTHSYEEIALDALTAQDLREEAAGWDAETAAYRITIWDETGTKQEPETADALIIDGRIGISWGTEAVWSDSTGDLDKDINGWLNDEDWVR